MNAALQCLAHVPPMRSYFALGEYEFDINQVINNGPAEECDRNNR